MIKYDYDFKLKVVTAYLNGEGGYKSIARQYVIPNTSQIERWVSAYKALGKEALKSKTKSTSYPIQFKIDVVNYMMITKYSAQEVANHFRINNITLVSAWMKKFLNGGFDGLYSKKGLPPRKLFKYKSAFYTISIKRYFERYS